MVVGSSSHGGERKRQLGLAITVSVRGRPLSGWGSHTKALSSQPYSGSAAKAKDSSGKAVKQPLEVMPITVWNPPVQSVKPSSSRAK